MKQMVQLPNWTGQANASNIMCVSKSRLGTYICDLPASDMKKVDEALAKQWG